MIRAEGRAFTCGLDLASAMSGFSGADGTVAEQSSAFRKTVKLYQKPFLRISKILKPVVAVIHGYCIGGGIDLAAACDMRICSKDALFSIREIKVGLTADIGTLQRIERIMNCSAAREIAFTGGDYPASKMKEWGFVHEVFDTQEELFNKARILCQSVACNR